jgi:hypothetical protein
MSLCLLQVEADQGRTEVKSWPCPEPVRGSDATQFKPGLTAGDRLTVWVGDIFQSADLVVNSSTELHGVKLLRYWLVSYRAPYSRLGCQLVCVASLFVAALRISTGLCAG